MSAAALLALAAGCAAAAAILDLLAALPERPRRSDRRRSGAGRGARPAPQSPAPRWSLVRGTDARTEALLDAAGRPGALTSERLRARERVAALVVAVWCSVLLLPIGAVVAAAAAVPAGLAGRQIPGLLLARAARAREDAARDEAPDILELIAAGAACGLPLGPLLGLAGAWLDGPLARGIARAGVDLDRGAAPGHVLAGLVRDHPAPEVSALVAILERSRRSGVPAVPALRSLADAARASRARRAGDRAARAAPRIQLVAALMLVPAALCILAAAMLGRGAG